MMFIGIPETVSGIIGIDTQTSTLTASLSVTGYTGIFTETAPYPQYLYSYYPGQPLWDLGFGGPGDLQIGFGLRPGSSLPAIGADIFWFSACCGPHEYVASDYNGMDPHLPYPPLGHIANLPLPLAIPAPELGTGWISLCLVVLLWLCSRRLFARDRALA
jgi:hypothetical protein